MSRSLCCRKLLFFSVGQLSRNPDFGLRVTAVALLGFVASAARLGTAPPPSNLTSKWSLNNHA